MTSRLDRGASGNQLVSCIMPTRNRRNFVVKSIAYFLRQDYRFKELIILDDGEDAVGDLAPSDERIRYLRLASNMSIGAKRNLACEMARGAFIAHWDDDDWIASNRLSVQMARLDASNAQVCGAGELLHYCPTTGQALLYRPLSQDQPWVAGCTLFYRRSFWEEHPFLDVNVGEDTAFVSGCAPGKVLGLTDSSLYVAIIHPDNASAKNLKDPRWLPRPLEEVSRLLWADRDFYAWLRNGCPPRQTSAIRSSEETAPGNGNIEAAAFSRSTTPPKVSCIMTTHNRRPFVEQAIKYFLRQDYPNKELVVVDDGNDAVSDLVPLGPSFQYLRLSVKHTIGVKRNLACEAARGEILLTWDDDDWYAPGRISYQVQPLLEGKAEVTGLGNTLMLSLATGEFWTCTPALYDHMFFQGVHGGTLAFWKEAWRQGARFANASLAEEVPVQQTLMRQGARLKKLPNQGEFVYVRHGANAWQFTTGEFLDRSGWSRVPPPSFIPEDDLRFYGLVGPLKNEGRREEVPTASGGT